MFQVTAATLSGDSTQGNFVLSVLVCLTLRSITQEGVDYCGGLMWYGIREEPNVFWGRSGQRGGYRNFFPLSLTLRFSTFSPISILDVKNQADSFPRNKGKC